MQANLAPMATASTAPPADLLSCLPRVAGQGAWLLACLFVSYASSVAASRMLRRADFGPRDGGFRGGDIDRNRGADWQARPDWRAQPVYGGAVTPINRGFGWRNVNIAGPATAATAATAAAVATAAAIPPVVVAAGVPSTNVVVAGGGPCSPSPCLNGGGCSVISSAPYYACSCAAGTYGTNCQYGIWG